MKYTKDTLYQLIPSILSSNSGNSGNSSNSSNSSNSLKSTFQEKCDIFRAELFSLPPNTKPISLINYKPSSK
jgi:hypothetical protein